MNLLAMVLALLILAGCAYQVWVWIAEARREGELIGYARGFTDGRDGRWKGDDDG